MTKEEKPLWWIVAAIGLISCIGYADKLLADDLIDCVHRGRAAATIVMGVAAGVPLDNVNLVFQVGNQIIQDEDFTNELRKEIRPLLGVVPEIGTPEAEPYANHIGIKIAERCAYNYGAKFKKTASSEQFKTRETQCVELLVDEKIIAIHANAGLSHRRMVEKATRDVGVDDARWAALMKMIKAAHEYEGGPVKWFEHEWAVCMDAK